MTGYRRTVSFPAVAAAAKRSGIKIRSLSLPVRFQPEVSDMNDDVAILISWSGSFIKSPSPMWLLEGVQYISSVVGSLLRLMNHPLSVEQLRNSPTSVPISEDLIRLISSYGLFRNSLLDLSELQGNTRSALRRKDPTLVDLSIRAQKQAARNIQKLASIIQRAIEARPDITSTCTLPIAMCNAMKAVASASAIIFVGISVLSDESTTLAAPMAVGAEKPRTCMEVRCILSVLTRKLMIKKQEAETDANKETERDRAKITAMNNLDKLKECLNAMEISCQNVFRDLLKARVNILNTIALRSI